MVRDGATVEAGVWGAVAEGLGNVPFGMAEVMGRYFMGTSKGMVLVGVGVWRLWDVRPVGDARRVAEIPAGPLLVSCSSTPAVMGEKVLAVDGFDGFRLWEVGEDWSVKHGGQFVFAGVPGGGSDLLAGIHDAILWAASIRCRVLRRGDGQHSSSR